MQATTQKKIINYSNAKALRRARELVKVTRNELANRLNLTVNAVEKYESGRAIMDEEKILKVLHALNLNEEQFDKIKRGKGTGLLRKQKTVFENADRRSYRRVITKEVRVLKILRQMKNLTQDQASAMCGYSKPTIGHIENGRIEVPIDRIEHIVSSYGHPTSEFQRLMKEEVLRDEIIRVCTEKLMGLPEDKLKLAQGVIQNLN